MIPIQTKGLCIPRKGMAKTMEHFEKHVRTERLYEGRILNLRKDIVELENGKLADREIVEHNGGVCVVAVDENDMVYFVRQYRYAVGQLLLELPAGKLEKGEDPAACGRRELEEECGLAADQFELLATLFPTCAYDTETIYVYYARGLHPVRQHLDADEFLTVERHSLKDALELVLEGKVPDAKTQVGILKYQFLRSAGRL